MNVVFIVVYALYSAFIHILMQNAIFGFDIHPGIDLLNINMRPVYIVEIL